MAGNKTIKQKTKIIPVNLGDMIVGIPFDIGDEKFNEIFKPHLIKLGLDKNKDLDAKIGSLLNGFSKSDNKHYLVSQMVEAFSDISQDLVDKASSVTEEDKTILHILARNVSALGASQLLFNYAYFIEFVTILRMIFEQCGYVVSWVKKNKKPKKGPQSIQISEFNKEIPSATPRLYGELCETAHLNIYKEKKIPTVSNEYEIGDSLILASQQRTFENYSVFLQTFNVLVETVFYVVSSKFRDDKELNKYVEVLCLNKECINMLSENGTINEKRILELFPNAIDDAVKGFDKTTQQNITEKYGSVDAFARGLKEHIDKS